MGGGMGGPGMGGPMGGMGGPGMGGPMGGMGGPGMGGPMGGMGGGMGGPGMGARGHMGGRGGMGRGGGMGGPGMGGPRMEGMGGPGQGGHGQGGHRRRNRHRGHGGQEGPGSPGKRRERSAEVAPTAGAAKEEAHLGSPNRLGSPGKAHGQPKYGDRGRHHAPKKHWEEVKVDAEAKEAPEKVPEAKEVVRHRSKSGEARKEAPPAAEGANAEAKQAKKPRAPKHFPERTDGKHVDDYEYMIKLFINELNAQ
jgi:hypothetical protein